MGPRRLGVGSWWAWSFESDRRIASTANAAMLSSFEPPIYAVVDHARMAPYRSGWVVR